MGRFGSLAQSDSNFYNKEVALNEIAVSIAGIGGVVSTATLSNVGGTDSSTTLLSSNSSRKGLIIHNDSTAILYVKFGTTASSSSYTYRLNPQATLERIPAVYTGRIDGIWASANGNARVTEL